MAAKKKNWIAGAIKHPGALTRAAAAKGQTISEFSKRGDLTPLQKKRVNLAKTLKKLHSKG